MSLAFYRKYRGTHLSDIVGQNHITETLQQALNRQHISHAYLFTGPRGVGKTSVARILAYAINNIPYHTEAQHLDIIEIDAASNRRIDEIRDLREKVHIAPTSARYKVYIIDEVHMLTREAFNALLKTLEEPPRHVVFILATTEAHKVPDTIASRAQRHVFRPIKLQDLTRHLRYIAEAEAVSIDDEALELIAEHGDGSFRDSISLLDQISHGRKSTIRRVDVENLLGLVPHKQVDALYDALCRGSVQGLAEHISQIIESGIVPAQIAHQLVSKARQDLLDSAADKQLRSYLPGLMERLLDVPAAANPRLKLESALFEFNLTCSEQHEGKPATPRHNKTPAPKKLTATTTAHEVGSQSVKPSRSWNWDDVLSRIKDSNASLYAVLRQADATVDTQAPAVVLTFPFAFHQRRLEDNKNRNIVLTTLKEITGRTVAIQARVAPRSVADRPAAAPAPLPSDNTTAQDIINLMGGGEEYNGEL